MHKKAKKKGFLIDDYNRLRQEAHDIETQLRRLRDPLYLRHSPSVGYKLSPSMTPLNAKDQLFQQALTTNEDSSKRPLSERLASILESTAKKLKK